MIAVLDAGGVADGTGQTLEDLSTDGDTIGGITGTVSFTANADWAATTSADVRWNDSEYDYSPGSTETATWTFGGLTSGDMWDVFGSWGNVGQANLSQEAPYTIQGGANILVNQEVGATGDLVLVDSIPADVNFQKLGTATVDGAGQVIVTLSGAADDWVIADAVAITPVPEPSSFALCGLALLCLGAWRRRS